MSYAIVGILVVAFIAFVVLSAKAWHWSNVVFLCLTFLTGLGGLIAMSQVLDARRSQMKDVQKSAADLMNVERQIEQVLYGDGLSFEYSPESLRGLSEALNLELAGRGRVWKNGEISASGTKRVFKFSAERVANPDNPADMLDMILFVYSNRVFEGDENIYPAVFVGSFKVVAETPDTIEMEPVFVSNREEYNSPTSSWTLFEKSPVDQRDAFIRNTDIVFDLKSGNDEQLNQKMTEYRNILVQQFMPPEMFGFDVNDQDQARKYELIVDRFMFDGLPLVKIESWIESQSGRIAKRFDPSNEEVFVRYRFDEKSNRPYQVDADGNIENDGQFTKTGYAVDPSLHAGGEIEFQKGDEILVDKLSADGYQRGDEPVPPFSSQEPVTEVNRVFVRQLNDYPFLLKTLTRQNELYTKEIEKLKAMNSRSQEALANAETQAGIRDTEIELLFADQEKFQKDVNVVKEFLNSTRLRKDEIETAISKLLEDVRGDNRTLRAIANVLSELQKAEEPVNRNTPIDSGPFLNPSIAPSDAPINSLGE